MIFLFEQRQYSEEYLNKVLPLTKGKDRSWDVPKGFVAQSKSGGYVLDGVGYLYNGKEIVFVLPKVFLGTGIVKLVEKGDPGSAPRLRSGTLGKEPPWILRYAQDDALGKEFLSKLALWVCSSIGKYRLENPHDREMNAPDARNFVSDRACPTLIDVKNAMERFYEENRSLFVFVSKNTHSGNNRVDWRRTMRKMPVLVGSSAGSALRHGGSALRQAQGPWLSSGALTPVYMELVNKRKVFDLDDRLIVLYFSAMNYIHEVFGFRMPRSEFYEPIRVNEFRRLLGHRGLMELRRIKHKYFADRFLRLYNIMKAFFEWGGNFAAGGMNSEYLLTSKYNNVFEAMIDRLVGDPEAESLKHNDDGKVIDHLYKESSLIFSSGDSEKIWHIGDSKYYTDPADIRGESIAKQFTYAKNIIQDFFSPEYVDSLQGAVPMQKEIHRGVRYRDPLTEGYSVTPNFFIRGGLPKFEGDAEKQAAQLRDPYFRPSADEGEFPLIGEVKDSDTFDDGKDGQSNVKEYLWNHRNRQFQNRLFDRDTLLLQVYNVNFLYVLKAYTAKGSGMREEFRTKAREMFRKNFLGLLKKRYAFWAVWPKKFWDGDDKIFRDMIDFTSMKDVDDAAPELKAFVLKHGRALAGKMFRPEGVEKCIVVALERGNLADNFWNVIEKDCEMILPLLPEEIWGNGKVKYSVDKDLKHSANIPDEVKSEIGIEYLHQ